MHPVISPDEEQPGVARQGRISRLSVIPSTRRRQSPPAPSAHTTASTAHNSGSDTAGRWSYTATPDRPRNTTAVASNAALLGVLFVPAGAVNAARRDLRRLLLAGQRQVRTSDESPRRRRQLLGVVIRFARSDSSLNAHIDTPHSLPHPTQQPPTPRPVNAGHPTSPGCRPKAGAKAADHGGDHGGDHGVGAAASGGERGSRRGCGVGSSGCRPGVSRPKPGGRRRWPEP